jgi:hypothetical protein
MGWGEENWRLMCAKQDNNPSNGTAEIHLSADQETKFMVDSIINYVITEL